MSNKEPDYVYILTRSTSSRLHICKNPSFREDWVMIDKSSRSVDVRSKEEIIQPFLCPSRKGRKGFCPFCARYLAFLYNYYLFPNSFFFANKTNIVHVNI